MDSPEFILQFDSSASEEARDRMIFQDDDRIEADRYLQAVDSILCSLASSTIEEGENTLNDAIQIAMARLEYEFRHILITHTIPIINSIEDSYPSSSTSIHELDLIPYYAVNDLRRIADRMISAGYLRECIQVYGSVRRTSIDSCFRRLGIEKLSIGDVQGLEWNALELKIRRWIRAAKICVRVLFANEKDLCEQIFEGLGCAGTAADDACFMETVMGLAIQLFNFAEAIQICIGRQSPDKLFKILDLHDVLDDLLPDVNSVFGSKALESIRVQAAEILSRLAEAARGILSEFENAIQREPSKVQVPGGTLHPLTRYVMNYISFISDYKKTLLKLIVSEPSMRDLAVAAIDVPKLENRSTLALHLIWIMAILQFNLEDKSKYYKDLSLAHIFMMNNIHYIVQKVKGSPKLLKMIGDDYLRKLTCEYRQAATNYERATWNRILCCLRDEGLDVSGSFSSGVSKSALRKRLKTFNSIFEEVHRIQSTWIISDPNLQEELRISISEKLILAYCSFLGQFREHIKSGKHPELYIKYSVENLEKAVMEFFEGV
ncbi:hypothetical protein GIB67_031330 [Kingdonia uniflora]|uniref:Exocyst subunit Exo70 family protein n=1 Tax=Kingdonia uniflora TaxID=39325 RepID=A0A7J7LUS6_9MAGN|nr:hypothetical protein GIB67_031330 [Kingdonia uniflora]